MIKLQVVHQVGFGQKFLRVFFIFKKTAICYFGFLKSTNFVGSFVTMYLCRAASTSL